jgi:phage gp29-like protein
MKLISKIRSRLGERITVINSQAEPESWMEYMDAARVAYVLRCARGGSVTELFALFRDMIMADSHLQVELTKRKLAVIAESPRFTPDDKSLPQDVQSSDYCREILEELPSFLIACSHLMDSTLWPVALVEKVYRSNGSGFALDDLVPVPAYLLDFSEGRLMVRDTDPDGQPGGAIHEPDPARYIIHRGHLLNTPDNYGGPMRSLIYWQLGSAMDRDWWMRFLDRYGMPFIVGKFASGNEKDKTILMAAFSAAKKIFGLAVSNSTAVEIIEASQSGADAFNKFHDICQREKSKLILGQTLSAQTDATGQGSGVADLQGDVREDFRRFDSVMLGRTLRSQLFSQMLSLAGQAGSSPKITWGSKSASELKAIADMLTSLATAGFEVDDFETLSDDIGYTLRRKQGGISPSAFNTQGLRELPANVAQSVRIATSDTDLVKRILATYSADPDRAATLTAQALRVRAACGSRPRTLTL